MRAKLFPLNVFRLCPIFLVTQLICKRMEGNKCVTYIKDIVSGFNYFISAILILSRVGGAGNYVFSRRSSNEDLTNLADRGNSELRCIVCLIVIVFPGFSTLHRLTNLIIWEACNLCESGMEHRKYMWWERCVHSLNRKMINWMGKTEVL